MWVLCLWAISGNKLESGCWSHGTIPCVNQDQLSPLYTRIYTAIQHIPPGYVMTYGAVGAVVGCPARVVGYALHHLFHTSVDVPWQRVINRHGGISTSGVEQRALLEAEGVVFESDGTVDLARYTWHHVFDEATT